MDMEWEKILADSVQNGTIRELHLRKLPVLKTTTNWRKVEPVGLVEHQMKHTYYKGGLVKLNGKLYFVQERTLKAVQEFIQLNFKSKISVIE